MDLASNTPNIKGPTRAQVAQFGDNYLLNDNPSDPLYYKYSWYQIPSDFDYIGINSDLGHGWRMKTRCTRIAITTTSSTTAPPSPPPARTIS